MQNLIIRNSLHNMMSLSTLINRLNQMESSSIPWQRNTSKTTKDRQTNLSHLSHRSLIQLDRWINQTILTKIRSNQERKCHIVKVIILLMQTSNCHTLIKWMQLKWNNSILAKSMNRIVLIWTNYKKLCLN